MTRVDQFQSFFRSADKTVFAYERVELERILLVTDLDPSGTAELLGRVRDFLSVLGDRTEWLALDGQDSKTVEVLLAAVNDRSPDLVCTYRNLHSEAWRWPYSLGEAVDVLTQIAPCPVLVLPHPKSGRAFDHALENTDVVMAMTSHLAGDASLVNHALRFTKPEGTLWLSHVEDEVGFARFVDAVSKIPSIDTDEAREKVLKQLLKEPEDYIQSCRGIIREQGSSVRIEQIVTVGHHLREYKRLIESHEVDLLVMHTKDEDQLAMHGLAYPLAIELREIPLLLL